jgi:hypothetical protein
VADEGASLLGCIRGCSLLLDARGCLRRCTSSSTPATTPADSSTPARTDQAGWEARQLNSTRTTSAGSEPAITRPPLAAVTRPVSDGLSFRWYCNNLDGQSACTQAHMQLCTRGKRAVVCTRAPGDSGSGRAAKKVTGRQRAARRGGCATSVPPPRLPVMLAQGLPPCAFVSP